MLYRVTKGCTFCGECLYACPVEAIQLKIDGAVIDQDKCVACGACYDNCASEAIEAVDTPEDPKRKEAGR